MKKKLGLLATLTAALFIAIQPAAAQDRGDWNRSHFNNNRGRSAYNYDRHEDRNWRAPVYREDFRQDRAWREREFRERERCYPAYGYGYRAPGPVVGFQFYGR